jgi:hypothetical protein
MNRTHTLIARLPSLTAAVAMTLAMLAGIDTLATAEAPSSLAARTIAVSQSA